LIQGQGVRSATNAIATLGQLSEPLLRYLQRRSGGIARPLLDTLSGGGMDREPPPAAGASGLNSNGMPLQLCVSARCERTVMVLVADPCAHLENPRARQRESVACAWRLLEQTGSEGLASALRSTLTAMLPAAPGEQDTRRMGVLWLGAGVQKPAFTLYTCPAWDGDVATGWNRVERWLRRVLQDPQPALRMMEHIRDVASPDCACIEGAGPGSARAKVYFRLLRAVDPNALSCLRLNTPEIGTFIEEAVGSYRPRISAMVFGVSFRLDNGEFSDSKVDLCGHCVQRPVGQWQSVLRRVGERLQINTTEAIAMLQEGGIELACIGIGRDYSGALRINTYGRPVRPMAHMSDRARQTSQVTAS